MSQMLRTLTLSMLLSHLRVLGVRAIHLLVIVSLLTPSLAGSAQAINAVTDGQPVTTNIISFPHWPGKENDDRSDRVQSETVKTARPWYLTTAAQLAEGPENPSVLFIENVGQFDDGAKFIVRGEQGSIFLAQDAIWVTLLEERANLNGQAQPAESTRNPNDPLASIGDPATQSVADQPLHGVNLRLTLSGANPNATIEGFDPLDTKVSYFIGNDSSQWRPDVPVYAGVRYVDIYPGVNLEITSENGRWAWRLVAQNASAFEPLATQSLAGRNATSGISLQVEGATALTSDGNQVNINTEVGAFSLPLLDAVNADGQPLEFPITNQVVAPEAVTDSSVSDSTNAPIIEPDLTPTNSPTPIDSKTTRGIGVLAAPILRPADAPAADGADDLLYSTFLGGSSGDYGRDIVVDSSGAVYITGRTGSSDFPIQPGSFDPTFNGGTFDGGDAFVLKFNPALSEPRVYSTFLGGSGNDDAKAIAVDASGASYITGNTVSGDFPFSDGAPTGPAFIVKLSPNGDALTYAMGTGAAAFVTGFDIAVDMSGAAYVTGTTGGSFPTTPTAYQPSFGGGSTDAFVVKLNPSGSAFSYATYLGGTGVNESGLGIAIDTTGAAYVTGFTSSYLSSFNTICTFPVVTGSYRTSATCPPQGTVFVAKLNSTGSGLVYSTYLADFASSAGNSIQVDTTGNAYVGGSVSMSGFPALNGWDTSYNGGQDGFVTKLNVTGSALVYSTFLGGSSYEGITRIALDNVNNVYAIGETTSTDFPKTSNAYDQTLNNQDAFVSWLSADGMQLPYSTFLGGANTERGSGIAVDNFNVTYLTGQTDSSTFPTTLGAYDRTYNGAVAGNCCDAFFAKLRTGFFTPPLPPSQAFATNECPFCNNRSKVYTAGMGINVNSGNYNHQHADGQVTGVGARLSFERAYNSVTTGADPTYPTYNDVLGYGWTHNYNVRLILPADPGGEPGLVKLIAPRGSVMQFTDNGNGTYSPFPAVLATLIRTDLGGGVYEYRVVTNSQYEYVFNNDRKLVSIFDPQDHETTLTYTGAQLTQVQDASRARRLKFFYTGGGRIERVEYVKVQQPGDIETALGQSTYVYTSDDLTSIVDFDNKTWTYQYNSPTPHLLTKVIDPSAKTVVETVFDTSGRATIQYDGSGKRITEVLSYATDQRQLRTDSDDDTVLTTVTFSGGVPVSVDAPGDSDSQTQFVGQGINPGTVTDPNGNDTTLTWSADGGNLTQVQDALNNTTSMQYDSLNQVTQVTDDLGRITKYEYFTGTTLLQRAIANYEDGIYEVNEPNNDLITTYTYTDGSTSEPAGLVRTQIDPRGIVTRYTYTPLGQRETVTVNYVDGTPGPGDDDLITSYTYDDRGRLLTATDLLNRVTKNEYDANGNLFRVTRNFLSGQPQNYQNIYNLITEYQYDTAGRLVNSTDTLGRIDHTCYDSAGRVVKTIQNPSVADPCLSYPPSADPALDRITTMTYR